MKIVELRKKSYQDLEAFLIELRKIQFELRIQKSIGQLGQTHLLKENKKVIARIKTLMNSRKGSS